MINRVNHRVYIIIATTLLATQLPIAHKNTVTLNESEYTLANSDTVLTRESIPENSKQKLIDEITYTEDWLSSIVVGDKTGQYPQEPRDMLLIVIEEAKSLLANTDATSQQFEDMYHTLVNASNELADSVHKDPPSKAILIGVLVEACEIYSLAEPGNEVGQYPSSAYFNIGSAIAKAQDLTINDSATEEIFAQGVISLQNSINLFKASVITEIDKTPLLNSITEMELFLETIVVGDRPGQYSNESKDKFSAIIENAKESAVDCTYADMQVIISELMAAKIELSESVISFESIDRVYLTECILSSTGVLNNSVEGVKPGQYTKESRDKFRTAISDATTVLDEFSSLQIEVDQSVQLLSEEKDLFVKSEIQAIPIDTKQLEIYISDVSTLLNNTVIGSRPGQISQSNYSELESSYYIAIEALSSSNLTQTIVDTEVVKLEEAIDKFMSCINAESSKTALYDKIDEATTYRLTITNAMIGEAIGCYPGQAVADFDAEIISARNVAENQLSSQAEVDDALALLSKAIDDIKASIIKNVVNKDGLLDVLQKAESVVSNSIIGNGDGEYPENEHNLFTKAIEAAKLVYNNSNSTQDAVDIAIKDLNSAILVFQNSENSGYREHIDKLIETLNTAKSVYDTAENGSSVGNYSSSDLAKFKLQIDKAESASKSSRKDSKFYIDAKSTLEDAIDAFKETQVSQADIDSVKLKLASLLSQISKTIKETTLDTINGGNTSNQKVALSVMHSKIVKLNDDAQSVAQFKEAIQLAEYSLSDFNDMSISISDSNVVNGRKLTGVIIGSSNKPSNVSVVQKEEFIPQAGLPIDIKSSLYIVGMFTTAIGSILFKKSKK